MARDIIKTLPQDQVPQPSKIFVSNFFQVHFIPGACDSCLLICEVNHGVKSGSLEMIPGVQKQVFSRGPRPVALLLTWKLPPPLDSEAISQDRLGKAGVGSSGVRFR